MLHYEIDMKTPIGKRKGWIELEFTAREVNGKLFILDQENEVTGTITPDGKCELSGSFSSLMKKYSYQASGIANEDYIYLTLLTAEREFIILGKATASSIGEKKTL